MSITPLQWASDGVAGLVSETDYGLWRLNPYDVAGLSLQLRVPGTTTGLLDRPSEEDAKRLSAAFDQFMSHPGKAERTEEYQRLGHHFGMGMGPSYMFGETVEEARMLAEAMHVGDADLAPATEQLAAAGFALKYPGHDTLGDLWSIRIRSGSLDVTLKEGPSDRIMRVRFHGDGARFWHNVAEVTVANTGRSGTVLHHAHAPHVADPLRVGVAHLLKVMALRLERGGRFSKPLGKVLRPH